MNTFNLSFAALTVAASLAAQSGPPAMTVSYDRNTPEVQTGQANPVDIGHVGLHPGQPSWLTQSHLELGLLPIDNIDAAAHGFSMFVDSSFANFQQALCYTVDRNSQGIQGNDVWLEATQGDGAACDVFAVDQAGGIPQVGLAIETPQLTRNQGAFQSNLDALRFDFRYPVFFSVDAATAARLTAGGMATTPADILRVDGPFLGPRVFMSHQDLGLAATDDIDALCVGPQGFLFSLTRTSPTAVGMPQVGGAGLYINGPTMWSSAAEMGLLTTDELDGLECETMDDNQHSPMVIGESTTFRASNMPTNGLAFCLASFIAPQPTPIPGLPPLGILPDLVLGSTVVDPLGEARLNLLLPPTLADFELSTQWLVLDPQGGQPILSDVSFAPNAKKWGWAGCTLNGDPNGYTMITVGGGQNRNHGLRFQNVKDDQGRLLNGPVPTLVTYRVTVNGQTETKSKKETIQFTNGRAEFDTGESIVHNLAVVSAGCSLKP